MKEAGVETGSSRWGVYSYFAAVMVLSAPLWFVGIFTAWQPLPGLPFSSLMVIVPGTVAFVFVARAGGRHRATRWLRQAFRILPWSRNHWLIVAVVLPPAILFAAFVGMKLVGMELPVPEVDIAGALALLAVFFIPAVFEELGWSCFAISTLQRQMSALSASLIVGCVWAVWHLIPLVQAGRTWEWIFWWCLTTVALRILITWIFNNTSRTLFAAALFHASENAGWQSFPVHGSHYDPAIHALFLWIVCSAVVGRYGWKTFVRTVRIRIQ